MKIGILTFVHAFNYGAELQCFALQRKLRNLGHEVEVLDIYRPNDKEYIKNRNNDKRFQQLYKYTSKSDLRSRFNSIISKLISTLLSYIYKKEYLVRKFNFSQFHKVYTNLSKKKYYNFSELYEMDELPYSHMIVGSDQIWNYMNEFSVEPFFLTFAEGCKKISYAASIGHSDIPKCLHNKYANWIKDFDFVSLREQQGVKIIKEISGRDDVLCTLDPTLLLTKDEWMNSLNIEKKDYEPYIIMYLLSKSRYSINLAKQIAKAHNLRIKIVSTSAITIDKEQGIEYYDGVSPREFISLFANASFAITNSFHGTAFSINFNIPFYSTTRSTKRYNSRFINLLDMTGLSTRLIFEDEAVETPSRDNDFLISFERCNDALAKERKISMDFLVNALKGNGNN